MGDKNNLPKPEELLYAPVLQMLKKVFDARYVDESVMYPLQRAIEIKNPRLEITAHGNMSDELQSHFDYFMFKKLFAEKLHPDIMGYVTKKKTGTEFITVEIKHDDLTLKDLMQAKLYEAVFNSKHSFLFSPTGMSVQKLEVVLQHDEALRGNVIIGKCGEDGHMFRISPKLTDKTPKYFQDLCRY